VRQLALVSMLQLGKEPRPSGLTRRGLTLAIGKRLLPPAFDDKADSPILPGEAEQ